MRSEIVVAVALSVAGFGADNVKFDGVKQGQLPPNWSVAKGLSKWQVHSDKTAPSHPNVLHGAATDSESAVIYDRIVCRDGDLSVKFQLGANRHGNAAGIVWRYQDPNNYYLLKLNADEKNIVLDRVRNGVAEPISPTGGKRAGAGVAEDIRSGQWHVVKVIFRGPKVQVFFGNRGLFTAEDSSLPNAGKTGLWAAGTDGAAFDDFRIDRKG